MATDVRLGCDGIASDEMTMTYLLRDGTLIARDNFDRSERAADPVTVVAELDRMTSVSREMAGICRRQRLDDVQYTSRAIASEGVARRIRETFGIA